jgi:hypothetical protein
VDHELIFSGWRHGRLPQRRYIVWEFVHEAPICKEEGWQ